MADINSNIKVNIDTSDALAQLKLLQQQISAFQQAMRNAGAQNAAAAAQMQQNLMTSINATGKFRANVQTIKTTAESFTESLEKNKFSIGEYFKYAGGASKTFGKLFKSEFATINQVAKERVKELQTQYIKLGRDANGAMKAIAVKPLALDMENLATKTQIAAQRQQLFNQLMKQGSTSLLNFGKNTQWAGRQLMVGFTVPLTLMGSAAAKAYMQIEAASIKFRRVYGDMNTTTEQTNKMVKSVQSLANEFTKYGVAVADTMDMAAQAAAMGKTGADLIAQINNAAKLSVLGGVDQQKALETTISLTNAFGISADKLSGSIDFLNAVENQTVLSIDDLTTAIPKAAPVVQQLGGDFKDLAFFMTAMKEGGINASEGANAIKSGLASLINPSAKASQFLQGFGINVKGIVEADKGNLKKTVVDFAKALDTLDPLNRARAIEQMFGKFQFSRLSTLFQNVIAEGSQASQVAELSKNSAEELAILSEREMKKISDSPMFKFQKSIQDMQSKLAPVGEAFLKAITPVVEFVSKILDGFNNLGEGAKNFLSVLVLTVAGIGPVLLMTFGLIANGVANIMKLFTNMKGFINKTTKPSDILGEQTSYMTTEQLKGAAVAASLDQAHAKLRQTFTSEKAALDELTRSYRQAVEAQQQYSGVPGIPTGNPNATPRKYANGVSMVPGPRGAGDIVPALLSPGEAVIPARHAQKYAPVIRGMIAGNLPGFEDGTPGAGIRQSTIGPLTQKQTEGLIRTGKTMKEISDDVAAGPYAQTPPTNYGTQITPTTGHSFPAFGVGGVYEKPDGTKVFVKPQMDLVSAMAEIRGTTIARDAHGLVSPEQALRVMMDPTDPENKRKFLVLESALDARLADVSKTFTKDQYFKQLVASLLRGDKDLGVGNLGGDVLADVGTAGVFQTASGKRKLGGSINSMEEQAIINLLGVKGGAKRFFAESTSDIAKSMSPTEYAASMKAEIQSVMPRLQATIAGFGNLAPEEKQAYLAMQQRLQAGMGVDWAKYQVMHSAVKPKEYNMGGIIPGYNEGTQGVKKESDYTTQELYKLLKIQETHAYGEMNINDPKVQAQLKRQFAESTPEDFNKFKVLSNLTISLPGKLNQLIKETNSGVSGTMFGQAYNALRGKLSKTAKMSGVKDLASAQSLEDIIGTKFAGEPLIKDSVFARIVEQNINEQTANTSSIGAAANLIWERTKQVGTVRPKRDSLDAPKWNDLIRTMLQNNELDLVPGSEKGFPLANTPFGSRFGRIKADGIGSSKTAEGRTLRKLAQDAANSWARSGNKTTPLPNVKDNNGNIVPLTWRDNSAKPGSFSTDDFPAYDDTSKKYSSNLSFAPSGFDVLKNLKMFADGGMVPGYAKGIANVGPTGKPKASVFDIDDTLLDLSSFMTAHQAENNKLPEDQKKKWYKEVAKDPKGIPAGLAALKAAQERGNKILLMTARPDFYEPYTMETLQKLGINMNGIKVIARKDKDYRKPEQMKYDKTSAYMKYYDIEEFYDDMDKTRGAISLLGIPTYNPLKLNMGGMIPGYANGVFSVPGPKGAGDVVPAMLSPGEAVIPADRAAQHRGLIKGMIAGNLPGYAKGTIIPGYEDGNDNVKKIPGMSASAVTVTSFDADNQAMLAEQSKVVALEEALLAKKKDLIRLTREQIEEQIISEDESYEKLIAKRREFAAKLAMTDEEKLKQQENEKQILQKEEVWMGKKGVEEKKQSGLAKAFTRSKFTGRVQGAMYGATAAAGAVSAMGGPIGEAAGAALPAIGAMTSAMSMIPGPAGMVVGGLMAVVAISAQLDAHFKALRDAAAKSTTAMGASVEAMKKLSEFAKTVGSRELMDKRRADAGTGMFYVKPGKQTFGESYMQSESGKELATATTEAIRVGDVKSAAALVTSQMGTAIAAGILSPEQARSVVANLAKQIKSTSFAININAKISSLFGPDGTPIEVVKNSIKLSMDALNVVVGNKPGQYDNANEAAAGGGAVNSAMLAALNTIQTNLDAVALNPKSTPKEIAAATAVAQTAMKQVYTTTDIQAGTNRDNVAAAARDAANAKYKDTSDAKLVEELVSKIQSNAVKDTYGYSAPEPITGNQKRIKTGKTGFNDTEEIFLTNLLGSGIVSPTNMKTATNMNISGADLVPLLKTNAKATDTLLGIAGSSGKTPKEQLAFMKKQKGLSSAELNARASALTTTGATTGAYFMDDTTKKKISNYYESDTGIEKAKKIDKQYKALQGKKTITLETVLKTVGTNPVMEAALKSGDFNKYFSKLKDKKNKVIFTTQFNSLMNLGTSELAGPIKAWLQEKNRMGELMNFRGNDADIVTHFKVEYSAYEANRVTEAGTMVDNTVNPEQNTNNEPAAKESSWLDQYVKTARDAGKATQALTTGFADSGAALKKFGAASPKLNGLFTQLKAAGASNDIIQAALGGDEATTKALIDVKTSKLKAGAKQILAGINLAIRQQKEIDWLGLTGAEKKQKYNDMYQADLEALKISEDEINKRYDDRIKALDEINTLNERNSAQQQSTLTLADALAKGDIAAAARAALEKRKQNTSFAIEDQKKNLELARTLELSKLVVDINGVQMTRAEVEEKIRINAEAITKAKATELELGIRIGQLAEREYSAVVNPVKKATGGLIMPKGYAYGGGIYGTDTVPAMLTPGEFVVKKSAVDAIGIDKLNTINSGNMPSDSVYNYSINVNVSSGADANDIAKAVMTQIRQTESQRIRSNTY